MTTPTVKMPRSRVDLAITGAAPVPVPPPMPAVMNTMWLFWMWSMISSLASAAASRPISGLDPAPRPWVAVTTQLNPPFRQRVTQRLRVGVGYDKVDAFELSTDHVVHGIAAGPRRLRLP